MTDDLDGTTAALSAAPSARELVVCLGASIEVFPLPRATTTIGRGEGNDVRIAHASLSRAHARLVGGPAGLELEDLGSANGSLVDGIPFKGTARVQLGSLLELGAVRMCVRVAAPPDRAAMTEALRLVDRVAPSPTSVLVLGETGAGKEVLTERLHERSGRGGPLVRINCAGLAASLLESELFGHEKGAFTGATSTKPGLIESANGGTLLLDELGEMPESTQPKLLRVLESREVRRVGAVRPIPVDVRFVGATHRDLRTLAALGKFRDDLLFRLNGLTIVVPPLRGRREEILGLASGFLREACARAGRPLPALAESARALLESYRWPGNVRELRTVMGRVALLVEGSTVLGSDLSFDPAISEPPPPAPASSPAPSAGERERIATALAQNGGNLVAAAEALGITARVLGYRMDKLGLPRSRRK